MRKIGLLIALFAAFQSYGQKTYIGVDLGLEIGKFTYFKPGLSLTIKNKKSVLISEFSISRLADLTTKNHAFKLEYVSYNLSGKFLPLAIGLNASRHSYEDVKFTSFGMELGLFTSFLHGSSGLTMASISYGRNFANQNFQDFTNKNYLNLSLNTNLIGFIRLIGHLGYKAISIFNPYWS